MIQKFTTFARPLPHVIAIVMAASAIGCSSPGGGGGGFVPVGGPPGTACEPAAYHQGCNGTTKVQCDPASKQWTALGDCATGQYCLAKPDPANPQSGKLIAACVDAGSGTADAGVTDSGGADAGAVTDGGSTDVGVTDAGAKDTAVNDTGAQDTAVNDTGAQDTAVNDTGAQDTAIAIEDTGGPVCGNGTCEEGETNSTCAKDCKAGPTCGDGACDSGETASTCAIDCGSTGACGDGKCTKGETWTTCAKDCGGATGPFGPKACWDTGCAALTAACKAHYVCAGYMGCMKDGLDGAACIKNHGWTTADTDTLGKALENLQTCAYKACADPKAAKCSSAGKQGAANRCGQFDNTWPCNCDDGCTGYGDCCSDYTATCKKP